MTYSCGTCGKTFERDGHRDYRYCSHGCFGASRKGRAKPGTRTLRRSACGWCGEPFDGAAGAGGRASYCSRSCQAYAQCRFPLPSPLTDTEAAYIAAMVDGEGTITIQDRSGSRPGSTRPSLNVGICGSYQPLMNWLMETTGTGSVGKNGTAVVGTRSVNGITTNKECYIWRLGSVAAVALLQRIEPFMIEKRRRALDAISSQPKALAGVRAA